MQLSISGDNPSDILASDLNTAPAGTFIRQFVCNICNAKFLTHEWAVFKPVVTPAEVVTDADADAPVVSDNPTFNGGKLFVELIFDTDAGVTKVYAPSDSVTCDIQVSASDTLLGYTVTLATMVYDVV